MATAHLPHSRTAALHPSPSRSCSTAVTQPTTTFSFNITDGNPFPTSKISSKRNQPLKSENNSVPKIDRPKESIKISSDPRSFISFQDFGFNNSVPPLVGSSLRIVSGPRFCLEIDTYLMEIIVAWEQLSYGEGHTNLGTSGES